MRHLLMLTRPRYSIRALAFGAAGLSGIVLLLDASMVGTLISTFLVSIGLGAALVSLMRPDQQRTALVLVATGLALRIAAAFGVYYGSLALGKGGFLGVDDGVYATAASMLVDYVRGEPASPANVPPYWAGHAYLLGPYVYLEALIFFLFGPSPLPVLLLNAAAMCGVALFASDMARRLFGSRAGLVTAALILFTPSLVVWSALNLKDSITIFLVAALLWALFGFQQRPRWWMLAIPFLIALPIEGLRRWAFYLLVAIIPVAVLVTPRLRPFSRAARWASAAALVSVLLLSAFGGNLPVNQINVGVMENIRLAMAKGARTGYAYLPPEGVLARPGDTFVIVAPSPSPTPSDLVPLPSGSLAVTKTVPPEPTPTPRVFIVAPGTRIVLATSAPSPVAVTVTAAPTASAPTSTPVATRTPAPTAPAQSTSAPPATRAEEPPTVIVRPGDLIIVSTSAVAPIVTQAPKPLVLSPDPETDQLSATLSGTDTVGRLVAYLPTGIVYALFAPFPWQLGRLADAATIPDMLLWYVVLGAAAISLWRSRARWRELTAITLFAIATLGVFAVAEGNTGTLFRHRAMTIPFAILLASPVLGSIATRLWEGLSRRSAFAQALGVGSPSTSRGPRHEREPTLPG